MFKSSLMKSRGSYAIARAGLALLAAGFAGGCGQKGPLKLPEPLPAAAPASQPGPAASAASMRNAAPPMPTTR